MRLNHKVRMNASAIALSAMLSVVMGTQASAQSAGDEIIVTATKTGALSIQDVPIAVTVNTGEQLETKGVINIENISAVSPSIAYQQTNNSYASAGILIRGIGSVGNNRSFEGAVGVFVDGIYRSRPGQVLQTFLDVDNVQILRGPQGTLFGKNTTAGAFVLESKKPSFDGFGGDYNLLYGNYDTYKGQFAVNIPVEDTLAFRFAASVDGSDGEWDNLITGGSHGGGDGFSVRASTLFEPSDDASFLLAFDYGEFERNCCYATADLINNATSGILTALGASVNRPFPLTDPFERQAYVNADAGEDQSDWGVTFTPKIKIGNGELTGIFGYREWESLQTNFPALYSPVPILELTEGLQNEQFSGELLYNFSLSDNVDMLLGGYYSQEDVVVPRSTRDGAFAPAFWGILVPAIYDFSALGITVTGRSVPGQTLTQEEYIGDNESLGLFARAEVDISDQFSVFGGIRYSEDTKFGSGEVQTIDSVLDAAAFFGNPIIANPDFFTTATPAEIGGAIAALDMSGNSLHPFTLLTSIPVPGNGYQSTFRDEAISFSVGGTFKMSENANFYASFNRGYKAGGVNYDLNAQGGTIDALAELGGVTPASPNFGSETTDSFEVGGKFIWMNGDARTNIAAFHTDINDLQVAFFEGIQFRVLNAAGAKSQGIELEHSQSLGDYFALEGGLTWLFDASIDDDPALVASGQGQISGRDLTRAPDIAINLALSGDFPVSDSMSLIGRADLQHIGEHFTSPAVQEDLSVQDAYTLFGFSGGVRLENMGGITIEGFCQNCFDKDYVSVHFNHSVIHSNADPDINGYLGDPRTYGVRLRGKF